MGAGNRVHLADLHMWHSIQARAEKLRAQLLGKYPGEKLHLIGHSMGGVDVRYAATSFDFQNRIASAIYRAIRDYYEQTPYEVKTSYRSIASAAPSRPAAKTVKHKIRRGDTLSELAVKYKTSVARIKADNNLRSNPLVLGRVLSINSGRPSSSRRPSVHTVKSGDSWSKISARYNVTISALKRINQQRSDKLFIGQKIRLIGDSTPPSKHKVRSGDTLSELAERYGISVSQIKSLNDLRSNSIRIGQTLKLR